MVAWDSVMCIHHNPLILFPILQHLSRFAFFAITRVQLPFKIVKKTLLLPLLLLFFFLEQYAN